MAQKHLTTGQAAIRCSVTPDTILKWIRSGLLPARRTAGGHHRIAEENLERLMALRENGKGGPAVGNGARRFRYCWEYNDDGRLNEGCRECAVYLMRAYRCYEVNKYAPGAFHPKVFCRKTCKECDYFKEVHEQTINVLVVTDDTELGASLKKAAGSAGFNLEIATCEYTCSAVVNRFRPDFVIVDCSLGQEASRDITYHLTEDPRVPFVRVVLAGNEGEFPNECDKLVFARLNRPFGIEDVEACIAGPMLEERGRN